MNNIEELNINEFIFEGQDFKNYNELCEYLGIEQEGGNTKKKNMRVLSEWCDVRQTGHRLFIERVFEQRIPSVSVAKYIRHIEILMLDFLSKQESCEIILPISNLLMEFNMCNDRLVNKNPQDVIEYRKRFDRYDEFSMSTRGKLKQILDSSINSMQRKFLINCHKDVYYGVKNGVRCELDSNEVKFVLDTHQIIFKRLGSKYKTTYETLYEVGRDGKTREFYKLLNLAIRKELGYEYTFKAYRIVRASSFYLVEAMERLIKSNKNELNGKIVDSFKLVEDYKHSKNFVETHNEMVDFFVKNHIE